MTVIAINHPLVRHKVGLLREDDISTKKFRELTNELARLLAYEATADFPLEKTTVACWSGPVEVDQIAGRKVTVVPILRAGLVAATALVGCGKKQEEAPAAAASMALTC